MKKLLTRNYVSIVKRGKINETTTLSQFLDKIKEEVTELDDAITDKHRGEELADVILTALNMAIHYNIDIMKELKKKIRINEQRND